MARLKIRGTWSGVLEDVTVDAWTVPKLREEVAMRANCSPDCINLTFAGMVLKDYDADAGHVRNLASLGVKINSKIFASRISPQESDAFRREEELFSRLEEIRVDEELAAEALKRNENDKQKALDDLKNPETISTLQADIESMKRERQKQATDFAIEKAVQMGFERSRVVAAFEAGGTSEEVIQRLKVQPEGPSDISKAEEQNEEIKGELSADIEIANEGPVIIFYLRSVELALRRLWEEDVPSQHDEKKEGYKFM